MRLSLTAALLVLSTASLAAQPATSDRAAAVRELQMFVNQNATSPITRGGVRGTQHFAITDVSGCEVRVEQDAILTMVRHRFAAALDLARLAPEADVSISDQGPGVRRVDVLTSDGDSTIVVARVVGLLGSESRLPGRREYGYMFTFRGQPEAEEARRLLVRAITACGGRPLAPRARAKAVADRLYAAGNDSATLRLKRSCRETIARRVGSAAASTLPNDSGLTVSRWNPDRLYINGTVRIDGVANRFQCVFLKRDGQYVPSEDPPWVEPDRPMVIPAGTRGRPGPQPVRKSRIASLTAESLTASKPANMGPEFTSKKASRPVSGNALKSAAP
jgi:hypothetical protein